MLHDLAGWFKTMRGIVGIVTKSIFYGKVEEVRGSTGPRSYPVGTTALRYWRVRRYRSFLNLAGRSHSEDILAVALASENLCETSPCAGCKSTSPDP
jgi:hypothetical protein